MMIVALTLRQWRNLVEATGLGEAFDTIAQAHGRGPRRRGRPLRRPRGASARRSSPGCCATRSPSSRELFDRHGVSWGPYQTFTQLVDGGPALLGRTTRCSRRSSSRGSARYLMPGSPLVFSAAERRAPERAPLLGEHTDEVLAGVLGLSDAEIGRLHDRGVVAGTMPVPG